MNILFLSLADFDSFNQRNIYSDLLREFIKNGHRVCCISPVEKRRNQETQLLQFGENRLLKLKIGNIQKVNLIEKGISTLRIESSFIFGVKKYFSDIKFDLILYTTPPVTFAKAIKYVKKRDKAKSYLMLKDIFPQNSIDLGMLSKIGPKGMIYKYFRRKEKKLYELSDKIGCMSQANCDYIIEHNLDICEDKVEICPNCIEPIDMRVSENKKMEIRKKYGLPFNKRIFIYGGNLGKPQDVPFIVSCLKACADIENIYFVIAGNGTDRHILEEYIQNEKPNHVKLFDQIPKNEYDRMIACCDVGLIFLDHRFTIPNFPSRLLSYMQVGLPVLACTDSITDIGKVIEEGGFGWWCESNDVSNFIRCMDKQMKQEYIMDKAWRYLNKHYTTEIEYKIIIKHFNKK